MHVLENSLDNMSTLDSAEGWMSSWDIMKLVYRDNLENMSWLIKCAAQNSVLLHLGKLEEEGSVETKFPDLWYLKKSMKSR